MQHNRLQLICEQLPKHNMNRWLSSLAGFQSCVCVVWQDANHWNLKSNIVLGWTYYNQGVTIKANTVDVPLNPFSWHLRHSVCRCAPVKGNTVLLWSNWFDLSPGGMTYKTLVWSLYQYPGTFLGVGCPFRICMTIYNCILLDLPDLYDNLYSVQTPSIISLYTGKYCRVVIKCWRNPSIFCGSVAQSVRNSFRDVEDQGVWL